MMGDDEIRFLQTVFDSRYRKVDDCNNIMGEADKRMDKNEKTVMVISTKLGILIGILSFIATALVPVVIKVLFGGA